MMRNMKKIYALLICLLLLCTSVIGCSGNGNEDKKGSQGSSASKGEVEVVWWTSYGTDVQGLMQDIIDDFNELHEGEYEAKLVYNGSNAELRNKLSNTAESSLPALITGQPIVNAYYATDDVIVPIQKYIDADKEDWTNSAFASIKQSYADKEGNLIGWPFGISCTGWLVNEDMVKSAGYSVDYLTSFEKIVEVGTAIAKKGLADYGMAFYTTGSELWNALTLEGADFLDNENGFGNGSVTKSVLDTEPAASSLNKYMKLFSSLYQNGYGYTYGAGAADEVVPAFVREMVGIAGCTNSYLYGMLGYEPTFNWTFIPTTSITDAGEYNGHAIAEGHGTYMVKNKDEKVMQGAYELIKFFAKAENQSYLCRNTGYIPYTEEAFNDADYQSWMTENYPDAVTLEQQILATPSEVRTPYCTLPTAIQNACADMLISVATYPDSDVKKVIQKAIDDLNEAIEIDSIRNSK